MWCFAVVAHPPGDAFLLTTFVKSAYLSFCSLPLNPHKYFVSIDKPPRHGHITKTTDIFLDANVNWSSWPVSAGFF